MISRRLVLYLGLAIVACSWALPFVWMLSTSIKPENQALDPSIGLLPELGAEGWGASVRALAGQVAANYGGVLDSPTADFPAYYRNSIMVAFASATCMTISSAFVAYGFARIEWKGREAAFAIVLGTMMVPFTVVMAPQYLLFKHLGLIGTLLPLWLPAAFGGAFSVFLLRQFFAQIPRELDEAARIDGCGHVGIFARVVLPNATPALAAVFLLQFVAAWNDFVGPLVFLNHQEQYTLALGLQMYQSSHGGTEWQLLMAACVLTVGPVLLVFALFQRAFTESIATRGLKG